MPACPAPSHPGPCLAVQDHPNTATYLGNLAVLEMALGRPSSAEPLLRRALEITINVRLRGLCRMGASR